VPDFRHRNRRHLCAAPASLLQGGSDHPESSLISNSLKATMHLESDGAVADEPIGALTGVAS